MIGRIDYNSFNQLMRIKNNLNSFIRQASVAKSQLVNSSVSYTFSGIGNNVDITA